SNLRPQASPSRKQPTRGVDIEYPLALTFAQAMLGLTTKIDVDRSESCAECQGMGEKVSPDVACTACEGTGQQARRIGGTTKCTSCSGTGKAAVPCTVCKRQGAVTKHETITVGIPAGVEPSSRVRVPGKGHAGRSGGLPGDLYIITNVGEHPYFKRQGDNIYCAVPITVPEAALGAKIEVPTVDGKALLRVPTGRQS